MLELKDLHELVELVNQTNISELKIKNGDFSVTIRTKNYTDALMANCQPAVPASIPFAQPTPVAPAISTPQQPPSNVAPPATDDTAGLLTIKSPMIGTFYRAPGPDKDPFVRVGDSVTAKTVVCVIEAMKLFNDIEAELSGQIVKVLVEDASPVSYDQPLFLIKP